MVRGLIPRCRPASLLEAPDENCSSTSRSRRVKGSRPKVKRGNFGDMVRRLAALERSDRLLHSGDDFLAAKRLLNEIKRAVLDGVDRHGDITLARHHEDRCRIVLTVKLFENIEPRSAGDVHIQQDANRTAASRDR